MKTFTTNRNTEFFVNCNQKTAAAYLKDRYNKPKNDFIGFIRVTRMLDNQWDIMKVNNDYITFVLDSNKRLSYFTIRKEI